MKEIAKKKNVAAVRRLTQEELLEEAKITEEINRRSLGLQNIYMSHGVLVYYNTY